MGRVQDKVVMITGAGSGAGRADALLLAREGAKIIATDANFETAKATAAEIGGDAIALPLNITREEDWVAAFAAAKEKFGHVDVLVNNAGILIQASIEYMSFEDWQKTLNVNVTGYYLGCKHGVLNMKEKGGNIINMGSVTSHLGSPNYFAYAAAKSAVVSLTRSVNAHAKTGGYAIRCNALCPDGILTPMVLAQMGLPPDADVEMIKQSPMGHRFCYPEDVANLVLFLASDESKFISGADIAIDNGNFRYSEF